jgi:hypothetical protein
MRTTVFKAIPIGGTFTYAWQEWEKVSHDTAVAEGREQPNPFVQSVVVETNEEIDQEVKP